MRHLKISVVLLSLLAITACSSPFISKPEQKKPNQTSTESTVKKSTVKKPNGAGGYYLDDGPGNEAPEDIDRIPNAIPKTETPLIRANKPYSALGQQYVPMTSYAPYKKQGIASWYGKRYHGKQTSTGEVYDMYGMSGAHPILPLPSYVKVTNPANGQSVIVRINDRGPFKRDRLIDLSYAAAYQLRLIDQGSGLVEVEAIDTSPQALAAMNNGAINNQTETTQAVNNPSANLPPQSDITLTNTVAKNAFLTPTTSTGESKPLLMADLIEYYVQAGAFKMESNGDLLQKKIQALNLAENVGLANVYNNGLYRVKLGPYNSKKDADDTAAAIRKQLNIPAIVRNQ